MVVNNKKNIHIRQNCALLLLEVGGHVTESVCLSVCRSVCWLITLTVVYGFRRNSVQWSDVVKREMIRFSWRVGVFCEVWIIRDIAPLGDKA